eukprot:3186116-Pleurochrysis_carterae.AAC.3
MKLTRASMLVAANAPTSFLDHAVMHATDVLNRTTGLPGAAASSYELPLGDKPRIMSIIPFGCRAYAV